MSQSWQCTNCVMRFEASAGHDGKTVLSNHDRTLCNKWPESCTGDHIREFKETCVFFLHNSLWQADGQRRISAEGEASAAKQ